MKLRRIFLFLIIYISFILEIFASFEIIEIYPNTDNDTTDEYVMIKNTSDEEASLSNFILSNKSGDSGTKEYIFLGSEIFNSFEEKKYFRSTTKLLLKNDGDELILKNFSGEIVDSFFYFTSIKGCVYRKENGNIISPNCESLPVNEEEESSEIIPEIDSEEDGFEENSEGNNLEENILGGQSFVVKYAFQSPTYLVEKDEDFLDRDLIFNCDRSKDDCRVNFNFEDTFTGSLKKGDFVCSIDFGLDGITGEESKCNPNTIIFPIGKYEVKVKITNKNDENYFGESIFTIINDGKLVSTANTNTYITYSSNSDSSTSSNKSQLNLSTPIIKIQSGLDSNNKCDKEECSVNFIYEPTEYKTTEIICKWDFGEGIFSDLNDEKCNPTYVKYGSGKHKVALEVCDKNYDYNCKNTSFEFENIYGQEKEKDNYEVDSETISEGQGTGSGGQIMEAIITLQGRLAKTKILEGNKLTCFGVESCSVNFTGENSIGEKLIYFWDFGNGQTFEGKNPTSIIFEEGEYTTILEITDKNDVTKEAYFDIIVIGKDKEEEIAELIKSTIGEEKIIGAGIKAGDGKESGVEIIEEINLKIELQGKIGQNKVLKGNELTCIKTCSVNFDGSNSEGKISSYFWDFGNGQTFSGKNPGYISYSDFGEYVVLFSVEDKDGSIFEKEFYINFVEKLEDSKKGIDENSNLISLDNDFEEDILVEFGGIDYNENEISIGKDSKSSSEGEIKKHFGKYIILGIIILGLGGVFVLLRKYNVL